MCLTPANARIWPNPLLYSFQLCKSAQTYWYRKYFEHIVARFQGDSSCLTIDNIKPDFCPNSAPLYNPMSVVDNSAPLFFHSSHFNCNNNKFNPLSRVLKENINKIYEMQHFTTLGNAAYKFFKTFRANPAWAKCVGVTGGVEYFREDRQHTCTILFPQRLCASIFAKIFNPPCHGRHTLPTTTDIGLYNGAEFGQSSGFMLSMVKQLESPWNLAIMCSKYFRYQYV